jgi:hypothetical protein
MWRATSEQHAAHMLTSDLTQQLVKERMTARMEDAKTHRLIGRRRPRPGWAPTAREQEADQRADVQPVFGLRSC